MRPEVARRVLWLMQQTQVYVPGEGAPCPLCKSRSPVAGTRTREATFVLRYHKCTECGLPFKSIETIEPVESPVITQNVTAITYHRRRGRRKHG